MQPERAEWRHCCVFSYANLADLLILFSKFKCGLFVIYFVLVVFLIFWFLVEISVSCSAICEINRRVPFAIELVSVALIVAIGEQDAGVGTR